MLGKGAGVSHLDPTISSVYLACELADRRTQQQHTPDANTASAHTLGWAGEKTCSGYKQRRPFLPGCMWKWNTSAATMSFATKSLSAKQTHAQISDHALLTGKVTFSFLWPGIIFVIWLPRTILTSNRVTGELKKNSSASLLSCFHHILPESSNMLEEVNKKRMLDACKETFVCSKTAERRNSKLTYTVEEPLWPPHKLQFLLIFLLLMDDDHA